MKFCLSGPLTIGTLDVAIIEIRKEIGGTIFSARPERDKYKRTRNSATIRSKVEKRF
jgi:glucan phosphorylase